MCVGFVIKKHAPCRYCSKVSTIMCLCSSIKRHYEVFTLRWSLLFPPFPPFSLNYRGFFRRGVLLILCVPLENRHRCLSSTQCFKGILLRPERPLFSCAVVEYSWKFYPFILVRFLILDHISNHSTR